MAHQKTITQRLEKHCKSLSKVVVWVRRGFCVGYIMTHHPFLQSCFRPKSPTFFFFSFLITWDHPAIPSTQTTCTVLSPQTLCTSALYLLLTMCNCIFLPRKTFIPPSCTEASGPAQSSYDQVPDQHPAEISLMLYSPNTHLASHLFTPL